MGDIEYILRIVLKARDDMARVLAGARAQLRGFVNDTRKANTDIEGLNSKVSSLNRRLGNLTTRFQESGAAIQEFASRKKDADELLDRNVELFGKLSNQVSKYGRDLRNVGRDVDTTGRRVDRASQAVRTQERDVGSLRGAWNEIRKEFKGSNDNLASLDNRLRSIGLLVVFAFAQQLISVLVGLSGSLVSVAGSAAMAGGALGGTLVAGIAQAIPMVGLLIGAFARVSAVMDAVNQAQLAQKQAFVQQETGGKRVANATDQIANAHDSLRGAMDRVTEAERALRVARREGIRDLEDLRYATIQAEFAARGAAVSQEEAQQSLRQAVRQGDVGSLAGEELSADEARFRRARAGQELRRARQDERRVGGNVENLDSVRQARKGLDDARDAAVKADRALVSARRHSTEAAAGTQSGAAALNFFLSQLSDSERKLYDNLQQLRETYKRVFRPITDIIIDSFARTVDRIEQVIRMPRVIRTATALARTIGNSIDKITGAFTSNRSIGQFARIAEQGRRNLGPLTDAWIRFTRGFLNIAEDAAPALSDLVGYVKDLGGRFEALTQNHDAVEEFFSTGETHLEAWVELGLAAVKLFFALTGAGGAATGLDTIQDATAALDDLTVKVHDNAGEVGQFFEDSRFVLDQVLRVLKAVAIEIFKSFDAERVGHFADFLIEVVIPAIGTVVRGVGAITSLAAQILALPIVSFAAKWGLIVLFAAQTVSSFRLAIKYFGGLLKIFTPFTKTIDVAGRALKLWRAPLSDADSFLRRISTTVGRLITRLPGMGRVGEALRRWGEAKTPIATTPQLPPGRQGPDFIVDADGNVVANDPRNRRQQRPPTSRRRRVAAGAGGALLGGGLAIGSQFTPDDVRSLNDVGGTANLKLEGLQNSLSALASFDVKGFFHSLNNDFDGFSKFAGSAEENLSAMVRSGNVKGIRDLAKSARDYEKDFPQAAAALEEFAQKADEAGGSAKKTKGNLHALGAEIEQFKVLGFKGDDILDPQAVRQFISNIGRVNSIGVDNIKDLRENMAWNLQQIGKGFRTGTASWIDAMNTNFGQGIAQIDSLWRDGKISSERGLREIRRITRQQMRLVRDNVANLSEDAKDQIAGNFRQARLAIERQTGGWRKATAKELKEIRRLMSAELEVYGLTPAQARRLSRNRTTRGRTDIDEFGINERANRAGGGVLGKWGERGKDLINTWVGRGEVVLNHWQQRALDAQLPGGVTVRDIVDRVRGRHAGSFDDQPGFAGGYAGRTPSGGRAVAIPGFPGEFINRTVLGDALALVKRFHLFITDAFARSGHVGAGHLQTGTAMDVVPGPRGSWDDVDRAVAYARSKGLTVLYNGVPNHGRGNHAHIELTRGAIGAIGAAVDISRAIRKIRRTGIDGTSPLANVGNAAISNTQEAAISTLRRAIRRSGAQEGAETGTARGADANVVAAFRRAIRSAKATPIERMALWMAGIVESGLKNLHFGDGDSLGALQERVSVYGRSHALDPFASASRFLRQVAGLRPWHGSAGALAQAVQRSARPGRYDQVRDQARRFFQTGGDVPGYGGGDVHPRWLEGGEHVWTKEEVSKAGGHGVMRALRAMLGGGGQGGPYAFQPGGQVAQVASLDFDIASAITVQREAEAKRREIKRLMLSTDDFRSISSIMSDIRQSFKLIAALKNDNKGINGFIEASSKLIGEGGFFDELRTAVERRVTRRQRKLLQGRFQVGARRVVTERQDPLEQAEGALDIERDTRGNLLDERRQIDRALARNRRRQRAKGLSPKQARALQAAENNLQVRADDADQRVADNVQSIFDAQAAVLQAAVQAQQDVVDGITKKFERQSAGNEIFRRIATALGNEDWLTKINSAQRDILTNQANELQGRIAAARAAGANDLADQLEDQVSDLRTQIFESIQQELRDSMDRINTRAQRRTGRLDLASRMLDATGVVGQAGAAAVGGERFTRAGIFAERDRIIRDQRRDLGNLVGQAAAQGNVGLVNELNDQIAELEVALRENTKAAFQARLDTVNQAAQYGLQVNDLNAQIITLTGQISGNTDTTKLLALAQEKGNILTTQGNALQGLLSDAVKANDQQAVQDLTTAILENEVAVLQNTQAINELTGQAGADQGFTTTAFELFSQSIFSGSGFLLPQYANVLPGAAAGAAIMRTGALVGHRGETIVPAHLSRLDDSKGGDTNNFDIDIYEAGRPIDTGKLASDIMFKKSGAK